MKEIESIIAENYAWVSYISPFKLIVPDGEEPLKVDLEEINSNTYNHGKLCRIIGMLPVLKATNLKMVVCYDGALAIPRNGVYQEREAALIFFNTIMCQLLLGGVLCEALDTRDIVWGQLHEKRALWPVDLGKSASSQLHSKLRMRVASNIDSIILSDPDFLKYSQFQKALNIGQTTLERIHNLTPSFLIRGVTELKYKNWSLALSSLWITIEQLTDYLWINHFLAGNQYNPAEQVSGRIKALKEDNRTWSSSVKQEILFQVGLISENVFQALYPARQARNRLVHDGKDVDEKIAMGAYNAIISMLSICAGDANVPIGSIQLFSNKPEGEKVKIEPCYKDWEQLSKEL